MITEAQILAIDRLSELFNQDVDVILGDDSYRPRLIKSHLSQDELVHLVDFLENCHKISNRELIKVWNNSKSEIKFSGKDLIKLFNLLQSELAL